MCPGWLHIKKKLSGVFFLFLWYVLKWFEIISWDIFSFPHHENVRKSVTYGSKKASSNSKGEKSSMQWKRGFLCSKNVMAFF